MVRAVDNKDRWIATVDLASGQAAAARTASPTRPGSTGASTISAGCRTTARCGTCPRKAATRTCTRSDAGGKPRALTSRQVGSRRRRSGRADGRTAYFALQPQEAGRLRSLRGRTRSGGDVREVTALDGVEDFALSPDGASCWCTTPSSYMPPQLAVVPTPAATAVQADRHPHAGVQGARVDPARVRAGAVASTAPARSGASSTSRKNWSRARSTRS